MMNIPPLIQALAHDLRWQLVTSLSQSDRRVAELVRLTQQPQNLVSYHLRLLRDAQLVTERRSSADARDVYYSLDVQRLQTEFQTLGAAIHPALGTPATALESTEPIRILFLCTENRARSQMAECMMRALAGKRVEVFSAGTQPQPIHPLALSTLAEYGLDASQQTPKHLDLFDGQHFEYVVTVCDRVREACPTFANADHDIHWSLTDPAAADANEQPDAFREVARQLYKRSQFFLMQLQG
ncbi:MAG: ArsR family transcriptional regulator [Anaerolineae bacterium]|nr:ArsR family transcriptional regulator [Anaerolineae bacterium]